MKRIFPLIFLLTIGVGYSQPSITSTPQPAIPNPKVEIKIEAEQSTLKVGEGITVMITIKNLTSQEIAVPETYWSACVLLDGKEFKRRLPEHIRSWSVPGVILPDGGYFYAGLTLSEYGIGDKILTIGKHELAVKIENDISNVLTITIEEVRIKELPYRFNIGGGRCDS